MPSDGALLPHLTVLQNIMASRRHDPDVAQEIRTRAASFGLDGILDRYPHEIQAGRCRLAGLARALWAWPDAIVLEDDTDVPSWGALLAPAWRGYQIRSGVWANDQPSTPELLRRVATVVIVPTRDRARALDPNPLVLDRGTTSAD